jgi:hypothetical protein
MFKPLQGVHGTLETALGQADNVMYVDAQLVADLTARMGIGNYTYLLIEQMDTAEAVLVSGFTSYGVLIERGKDGSVPITFLPGATIKYVLTSEAVGGMVSDYVNSLGLDAVTTFTINAPHTVDKMGNEVTIDIKPPNISSPDGSIDVTGSGLDIGVSVQRGAFGCCD